MFQPCKTRSNTPIWSSICCLFFPSLPWGTIALAKCLESKYWHLPQQIPLLDAPRQEPAGRKRQGRGCKGWKWKGRLVSSYFLRKPWSCQDTTDGLAVKHISDFMPQPVQFIRHYFGKVSWQHLTLWDVCPDVCIDFVRTSSNSKAYAGSELTSQRKPDSSLAHCPLTGKDIYFHMFPRVILTQLSLADRSFGLANLPAPTYGGGQLAGQMPSSSAPHWKISTFLTGQMSDTWQDCHPDSPTECPQMGYHTSLEMKVVFLFQKFFPPVCFHLAGSNFNSSCSQVRQTGGQGTDH